MNQDCVFCKIINRELPSKIEFENDDLMVFQNINPIAPIHLLIVPKKHIINLSDVSNEDQNVLGKTLLIAKEMAFKHGISDAFRLAAANGENAGQTIFHLHFHLTGGWKEKYNRQEDRA